MFIDAARFKLELHTLVSIIESLDRTITFSSYQGGN